MKPILIIRKRLATWSVSKVIHGWTVTRNEWPWALFARKSDAVRYAKLSAGK